jgi:hypothetical protein
MYYFDQCELTTIKYLNEVNRQKTSSLISTNLYAWCCSLFRRMPSSPLRPRPPWKFELVLPTGRIFGRITQKGPLKNMCGPNKLAAEFLSNIRQKWPKKGFLSSFF